MRLCKHGAINQKLKLKVSRQINYCKPSNEKTFTVSPQTTENITVEGNLRSAVLLVVSKQLLEEIYSTFVVSNALVLPSYRISICLFA